MTEIKTPAGIFSINRYEMPEGYTAFRKAEIKQISAEHIRIITMDQEVEWKDQKFSPVVYQSCMDPDNITVYPLEIECMGKKVVFQDHYHKGEWTEAEKELQIHDWYPRLKKGGCFPCSNCGRC